MQQHKALNRLCCHGNLISALSSSCRRARVLLQKMRLVPRWISVYFSSSAAEATLSRVQSKVSVFSADSSFGRTRPEQQVVLRISWTEMAHACAFECSEFAALKLLRGSHTDNVLSSASYIQLHGPELI